MTELQKRMLVYSAAMLAVLVGSWLFGKYVYNIFEGWR